MYNDNDLHHNNHDIDDGLFFRCRILVKMQPTLVVDLILVEKIRLQSVSSGFILLKCTNSLLLFSLASL